jgi:hypothetical protein
MSILVKVSILTKVFLDFQKWTKKMSKIKNPKKLLKKTIKVRLMTNML